MTASFENNSTPVPLVHFKNMSPEERRQFKRDMGKQDGMPPPGDDLPGGGTGDAGRPAK